MNKMIKVVAIATLVFGDTVEEAEMFFMENNVMTDVTALSIAAQSMSFILHDENGAYAVIQKGEVLPYVA